MAVIDVAVNVEGVDPNFKVSSWTQTDDGLVEIYLCVGKHVSASSCSVLFNDDSVDVRLKDGRTWTCLLEHPIIINECKMRMKKKNLVLIMKKENSKLIWNNYEKLSKCQTHPAEKNVHSNCVETTCTLMICDNKDLNQTNTNNKCLEWIENKFHNIDDRFKEISETISINKSYLQNNNNFTGAIANTANLSTRTDKEMLDVNQTILEIPNKFTAQSMSENGSVEKCDDNICESSNYNNLHFTTNILSIVNEKKEKDGNLVIPMNCNKEFSSKVRNVNDVADFVALDLKSFKTNFSENPDVVTIYIYIRHIDKSSCVVDYNSHSLDIKFNTRDTRCHQLYHNSDEKTIFHLHINLIHEINNQSCKHQLSPSCLELRLKKATKMKWDGFFSEDLPVSSLPSMTIANNSSTNQVINNKQQKPTCMVTPLLSQTNNENDNPPHRIFSHSCRRIGYVGLDNIGNTCFINCVIQALANTPELRNYFLSNRYQKDLNKTNVLGTGGLLANAFADMMVALWKGTNKSFYPNKIKTLIGQKQSRFEGYLQHDAEEFMEFLLDGLHEDLNRVVIKPYIMEPEDVSILDHKVASSISWDRHLLRNDSIIVDLFQGQYYSRITCPACNKTSIAYDPFSIVQVPIPRAKRRVHVIFFNKNHHIRPIKYLIEIHLKCTVENLLSILCRHNVNLLTNNLRVMECDGSHFKFIYKKGSKLSSTTQTFVVCEVYSADLIGEPVIEVLVEQQISLATTDKICSTCGKENNQLRRCTKCFKISYCNQICQRMDWPNHKIKCHKENKFVGCPFIISMASSKSTYQHFVEIAEIVSSYSVNAFHPPNCRPPHMNSHENKDCPVVLNDHSYHSLVTSVKNTDHSSDQPVQKLVRCVLGTPQLPPSRKYPPFNIKSAESDIFITDSGDGPLILPKRLVLEWKSGYPNDIIVDSKPSELQDTGKQLVDSSVQLSDCLSLFTEPEVLDEDHAWLCPHCKCQRQATKQMLLYRLPPILVIHIKRFAFNSFTFRQKIQDFVQFPLRDLDMSPYCVPNSAMSPSTYDLYAVINHHGFLLGGHYTTFAQCYGEGLNDQIGWRFFDDSTVTPCSENDVITDGAYVLFYKKKDAELIQRPLNTSTLTSYQDMPILNILKPSISTTSLPDKENRITTSLSSSSSMMMYESNIQLSIDTANLSYNDNFANCVELLNEVQVTKPIVPVNCESANICYDCNVDMNEID